MSQKAPFAMPAASGIETDVCLIVEGCYPYVRGGVSSWLDWLMRSLPETTFSVLAIVSHAEKREVRYHPPDNLLAFHELRLKSELAPLTWLPRESRVPSGTELAALLARLFESGGFSELTAINRIVRQQGAHSEDALINSPIAWSVIRQMYARLMPHASFLHFFWAWRALCGGLFAVLTAPLPRARVYHTISTGYAGLAAARAACETGRPAVLTEHGIYTNERRIEILMAPWIADTVDKGVALDDARLDLRDIWMKAFDAYARCCYEASSVITTLYEDNQALQINLGASPDRLKVIANGIDVERFDRLARASTDTPPTVALIGRVVPIKDVKTFIKAVHLLRQHVGNVRALVLGPYDEDPAYFAECRTLVDELDLRDTLTFTGNVDLASYLPKVHVVALTSLSEAQPLVLLEAGAAGIPCVATDVGSCREIIEGRSDERPHQGRGGIVCDLVDAEAISAGLARLLTDEPFRQACGAALGARVARHYSSAMAAAGYRALYQDMCARPYVTPSISEAA